MSYCIDSSQHGWTQKIHDINHRHDYNEVTQLGNMSPSFPWLGLNSYLRGWNLRLNWRVIK
jgi:hypothetical protein